MCGEDCWQLRCWRARLPPPRPGAAEAAPKVKSLAGTDGANVAIRRTAHGIPHILGAGFRDLGYGYGYAFAEDNICTIAAEYVTVRAERSRFFGADEELEVRWQRLHGEQPQQRLLLQAHHRQEARSRSCSPSRRRTAPGRRSAQGVRGLRGGLQPLPARHGRGQAAGSDVPRRGVGAPHPRDRRVPLLLRARAAGQLRRGDRRHRRGAAAHARRSRPAPSRSSASS